MVHLRSTIVTRALWDTEINAGSFNSVTTTSTAVKWDPVEP